MAMLTPARRTYATSCWALRAKRQRFSERHIIELTATVGAYNMVSRFLEALQVHSHDVR